MDTNTAIGRMITGLAIKAIGAGIAIWVAVAAATFVHNAFTKTAAAFDQAQNITNGAR